MWNHAKPPLFIRPQKVGSHKTPPLFSRDESSDTSNDYTSSENKPLKEQVAIPKFLLKEKVRLNVPEPSDSSSFLNRVRKSSINPRSITVVSRPDAPISEPPSTSWKGNYEFPDEQDLPILTDFPNPSMKFPSLVKKTRKMNLKVLQCIDYAKIASSIKVNTDVITSKKKEICISTPILKYPISTDQLNNMAMMLAKKLNSLN